MDAKGVTLKQLADALGYKICSSKKRKYIRMKYENYFRFGTQYIIEIYAKNEEFLIYCHIYIPKATISEIIIEQNGVKIVIEEMINETIEKIMKKEKYLLIGRIEDGIIYAGQTESGMIYKSEEAYREYPENICYVPEFEFEFSEEKTLYTIKVKDTTGYTRNDLMELCDNNKELCDNMFYEIDWQSPKTWLDEYDEEF
jgi:hypothetical protein